MWERAGWVGGEEEASPAELVVVSGEERRGGSWAEIGVVGAVASVVRVEAVAVGRRQRAEGVLGPGLVEMVEDESCRAEVGVVHASGRIDDDSSSKRWSVCVSG